MSIPRGPIRIVLIRSGGYDYAELELHEPVHLVAGNNVGKTTLAELTGSISGLSEHPIPPPISP